MKFAGYSFRGLDVLGIINRIIIGPLVKYIVIMSRFNQKARFLNTNSRSIGHLCIDIDCFLAQSKVEKLKFKGVLLASHTAVANRWVVKMWAEHERLVVISSPLLCFILDYLRIYPETNFDCSSYSALHDRPANVYEIYSEGNGMNMNVDPKFLDYASRLFEKSFPGVNVEKVVVLHCRDSLFDEITENANSDTQRYRNSDLWSYSKIIEFLINQGFTVIRIGRFLDVDATYSGGVSVIQNSVESEKEAIEFFLSCKCALFLGSQSGALSMASLFDRPIFVLNSLPYAAIRQFSLKSMTIPKILLRDGVAVPLVSIFGDGLYNFWSDEQYLAAGITIQNNLPDDVFLDFLDFFNCFVLCEPHQVNGLVSYREFSVYQSFCPKNTYDYFSKSLVPMHFFRNLNLI